jgi:hypothetical protein
MNKEFVPYEIALALKELGFNEPCFAWYGPTGIFNDWESTDTIAPLYQQAFRWFREKYGLHTLFQRDWDGDVVLGFSYQLDEFDGNTESITYSSYEEAELACLNKLIQIVKNGNSN